MARLGNQRTVATELAVEGRSPYPEGAAFVAADLAELGSIVARHARERRPVVLVYPDGDERILTAGQLPDKAQPETALRLGTNR